MRESPPDSSDASALIARPGARFRCMGDGVCCTDLHALGPLTRTESRALRNLLPDALEWNEEFAGDCLRTDWIGACEQLDRDRRCGVQTRFGEEHKPVGCRRFPYGLVDTETGRRVTTEHRCPCRSIGGSERPLIDLADAAACLKDRAGRLEADGEAPQRIRLSRDSRIPFAQYAVIESEWLDRLAAGERAEDVLDSEPLPRLDTLDWPTCGHDFVRMQDGSAGGVALAWFGDALLRLAEGTTPTPRARPWRVGFERGIARTSHVDDAERIVNDWLADELWMLRWLEWENCTLATARAELATRLAVARVVMRQLDALGLRADQSAAEAVMIAGLAASTTRWPEQVADIVG